MKISLDNKSIARAFTFKCFQKVSLALEQIEIDESRIMFNWIYEKWTYYVVFFSLHITTCKHFREITTHTNKYDRNIRCYLRHFWCKFIQNPVLYSSIHFHLHTYCMWHVYCVVYIGSWQLALMQNLSITNYADVKIQEISYEHF